MSLSILQTNILSWFRDNKRQLPWRGEKNWYHIWVSEVMLQQTQVETVIPYYKKFISRFKTVECLAKSSQEEVLKAWEGLGYYTRARNLHRAAKIITEKYNSSLPPDREKLLNLPGFGQYTTSALLSLVFNLPYGVVDGNVKRVISRIFAIEDDIRNPKTHHRIQKLMNSLLPQDHPGEFNEAVMELGATICTSKSPLCSGCPITTDCIAYNKKIETKLPYRSKSARRPTKYALACIIRYQDLILITKRPQHHMLAGLWEFPVLKWTDGESKLNTDIATISRQFNLKTVLKQSWPVINHHYTHFHLKLFSKLYETRSSDFQSDFYDSFQWLRIGEIRILPLHKAMRKVLMMAEAELETVSE